MAIPILLCEPDGRRIEGSMTIAPHFNVTGPLISCVMLSRGYRYPAIFAIECYRRQTYANRELVIVTANTGDELAVLLEELGDPTIRLVRAAPASMGELRNLTIAHAAGELICQWDDDDLSVPNRLELQTAALAQGHATVCYLSTVTLWWPARRLIGRSGPRAWENTMLVMRDAVPIYAAESVGEDSRLVKMIAQYHRACLIASAESYWYIFHGLNVVAEAHFERLLNAGPGVLSDADYDAMLNATGLPVADYAAFVR